MNFDLLDRTDTEQIPDLTNGFGNALQKIFEQNQSSTQGFLQTPQTSSSIEPQPIGGNSNEFKLPSFTPLNKSDIEPLQTMELKPFKPDSEGFNFLFDRLGQGRQSASPFQTMEDRLPIPSAEPVNKALDGLLKKPNESLTFGQTPSPLISKPLDKSLLENPVESGFLKELSLASNKGIQNPLGNFFEQPASPPLTDQSNILENVQRLPFDPDQPPNITLAGNRGGGKRGGKKGKDNENSQGKNPGETSNDNNSNSSFFDSLIDLFKPKDQIMEELLEKSGSEFTGNLWEDLWHIFTSSDDETSETEVPETKIPQENSTEIEKPEESQSPRPLDPNSKDFYKNNTQQEVTRDLDQVVNTIAQSKGIEPGSKEYLELRMQKLIEWEKQDKHPKYTSVENPHNEPDEDPLNFGVLPKEVMKQIEAKYGKDYRFNFGAIRLPIGNVWKDGAGNIKGMGKLKIDAKRASGDGNKSTNQLIELGFESTEDYVNYVGNGYDEIYFNKNNKRLMLIKRDVTKDKVNTLAIELSPTSGGVYNVITAIPLDTKNFNKNSGLVKSGKRFEKLWPK